MFMKSKAIAQLVLSILLAASVLPAHAYEEPRYFYFVISGTYHENGVGYASGLLRYAGYERCQKRSFLDFHRAAKESFNSYLAARYSHDFPTGSSNIQILDTQAHSTYDPITTQQQATDRINYWIAEERRNNHRVVDTKFTFSCD